MSVSVILPTFNEVGTILQAISGVRQIFTACEYDHEVIVVDDGSHDGTIETVREVYADCDDVRWRIRTRERGLATAVRYGMEIAEGDVYVVMDADLQHPPARVYNLLLQIESFGADLAIGSRFVDGGGVAHDWPLRRRVISAGAKHLARLAVPQARDVADPMSGFFAVRSSCVDTDELRPRGYKILLDVLARCPIRRVIEVPYTFQRRAAGDSNLGPRDYAKYLHHLGRLRLVTLRRREDGRPMPGETGVVVDGD